MHRPPDTIPTSGPVRNTRAGLIVPPPPKGSSGSGSNNNNRRHSVISFSDQNERVVAEERSEEAVRLVAEYDLLVADYDLNYDLPVYDQLVFDFLVVDYDLGIGV